MRNAAARRDQPRGVAGRDVHRAAGLVLAVVALALVCLAGLAIGARAIPPADVLAVLTGRTPAGSDATVVLGLRLPRTVVGVLAGVGLGVAGALVQAVTRNPLADPGILGTNSGAAFALAMGAGFAGVAGPFGQLALAFGGALAATLLVYAVGSVGRGGGSPVRLVLAGTALGAVLAGITSAIVLTDPDRFSAMKAWESGSLVDRGWSTAAPAAALIAFGLLVGAAVSGSLNAVALGDDLAASLGANVMLVRTLAVAAVCLLAGSATALAGPIAFVGLMVPHVARWIVGPDQRWVLPYTLVLAPILLVVADILGRVVMPPGEVPAGIVTAVVGAPVLIVLVRRRTASEL